MLKYNYQRGRWTEMIARDRYRTHYKQPLGIAMKKWQTKYLFANEESTHILCTYCWR